MTSGGLYMQGMRGAALWGRAIAGGAVDDRTVCFVWGKVRAWRQPARRIMGLMHVSPCAGGSWRTHLLVRPPAYELNI